MSTSKSHLSKARLERKISYEKERREKLSQLFKDLSEALAASGWPPEKIDTQVDCLSIAIAIIKRTPYDATLESQELKENVSDGIPELPEDSDSSLKDDSPWLLARAKSSGSAVTASTSTKRSDDDASENSARNKFKGSGGSSGMKRRRNSEEMETDDVEPPPSKSPKGSFSDNDPVLVDAVPRPFHSQLAPNLIPTSYQPFGNDLSAPYPPSSGTAPLFSASQSHGPFHSSHPPRFPPFNRPPSAYDERFETPIYPSASPRTQTMPPYAPSAQTQANYYGELRFLQSMQTSLTDEEAFTDHFSL